MKVTSMRGVQIDMSRLIAINETKVGLGSANMNARGDIINSNGTIVKKREEIAREYHKNNPKAVKQVSVKDLEVFASPSEAVNAVIEANKNTVSKKKIIDSE